MNIEYTIKIHSYWHCGSGLAAGANVDALVVKDKNGMPYIPGKTIKGLIREAVENYLMFTSADIEEAEEVNNKMAEKVKTAFGVPVSDDDEHKYKTKGNAFFTNAELESNLRSDIIRAGLQQYLFTNISSTAIDDKGIAVDNSLRRIEVTVPCELEGKIIDLDDSLSDIVSKSFGFIKRLGVSRNRGLGRCTVSVKRKEGTK